MRSLSLLLFLLVGTAATHDIAVGLVDITLSGEEVSIRMHLDLEDLKEDIWLATNKEFTQLGPPFDAALTDYLTQHTSWVLDAKAITPEIDTVLLRDGHLDVQFIPITLSMPLTRIELYNSCMFGSNPNFIHVVQLHQADRSMRGFRMDLNRQNISILVP